MDDIQQVGGIGEGSILRTYDELAENDPWVLETIQALTQIALYHGFWELRDLDETRYPVIPHKNHPVWEIVRNKRAEFEENAIYMRPHWMTGEDGLPYLQWGPNFDLLNALSTSHGPSSSVPSDVNSDNFHNEELRGRRQTPRSQPAASVSISEQANDMQTKAEDIEGVDDGKHEEEAEGFDNVQHEDKAEDVKENDSEDNKFKAGSESPKE